MRALLLLLCLLGAAPALGGEVAVIGASRELLSAIKEGQPHSQLRAVRGKPRSLRQALRAAGRSEHLLWIQVRGRVATAAVYTGEGKRLGQLKARLAAGRWTAAGMAQVVRLLDVTRPAPSAEPVAEASSPAPEPEADRQAAKPEDSRVVAPQALEAPRLLEPASASTGKPGQLAQAAPAPAPASAAAAGDLPADAGLALPSLAVSVGTEAVWRSYQFCPGTLQCGRQVFAGVSGLKFVTDAPYVGGTVTVTTFPLQRTDPRLAGLGLEVRYARRFLEVGFTDATGTLAYQPSYDEEFWGELLYRQPLSLFGLRPWHGVRVGAGTRRFVTGSGAGSTESVRKVGATLGLEGGLPLWERWVSLELGVLYALGVAPGDAEREAHGGAVVGSDSLRLRGGLRGEFGSAGLGYTLMAEYGLFHDSFFGAGTRAEGGRASEEFVTLSAGMRYSF